MIKLRTRPILKVSATVCGVFCGSEVGVRGVFSRSPPCCPSLPNPPAPCLGSSHHLPLMPGQDMQSTTVCSCGVQAQVWVQVQGCLLPSEVQPDSRSPFSRLSPQLFVPPPHLLLPSLSLTSHDLGIPAALQPHNHAVGSRQSFTVVLPHRQSANKAKTAPAAVGRLQGECHRGTKGSAGTVKGLWQNEALVCCPALLRTSAGMSLI